MILPVRAGLDLLTRWRPLLVHPSVRHVIAGRSRSETPQAIDDGSLPRLVRLPSHPSIHPFRLGFDEAKRPEAGLIAD